MYEPLNLEEILRLAGWTPHDGSECPVDPNSFPQVLTAGGEIDCERASDYGSWIWSEAYPHDNIIAYRENL